MRIYLDNCSFNRPFDDQSQIRIRLEAEAKLRIQEEIRSGNYQLIWSYILDYENDRNPFRERKEQIAKWKKYATDDIAEDDSIIDTAIAINQKGMKKLDSLHIACAIKADTDYFLTTDDGILKKATLVEKVKITDPIGFVKEVLT